MTERLTTTLGAIYDEYRTACLSKKYYGCRLARVKRVNLVYEIVLAIAASSTFASAATQMLPKDHAFGTNIPWLSGLLASIVALMAVIKPIIALEKDIERLSRLVASYTELFEQFRGLVSDIKIDQNMTASQEWSFKSMRSAMAKLSASEDLNPKRKTLERLQVEVRQEIPSELFWYPQPNAPAGPMQCGLPSAELKQAV